MTPGERWFWFIIGALAAAILYIAMTPAHSDTSAGDPYKIVGTITTTDGQAFEKFHYNAPPSFPTQAECLKHLNSPDLKSATEDLQKAVDKAADVVEQLVGATIKLDCVPIR
jgi:hypothetical protein